MFEQALPWVEAYRPKTISEVLGDETTLSKFKEYIDKKDIPHLLFAGKPGTGKSTIAKLLAKNITDENNILYICASDERGIDVIRNKIKEFCERYTPNNSLKVVILDEFDGMTWQSMEMMRNTLEEFIEGTRFILTCNYDRKIIDPIKSRCQFFNFTCPDESKQIIGILKRCIEILNTEQVTYDKKEVLSLIKQYYPDIRRTINALQKFTTNKAFKYSMDLEGSVIEHKLLSLLSIFDIATIRKEILTSGVDYNDLYKILFNNAGILSSNKKLDIMLIVGEAVRWHSQVLDHEINFVTCLVNICLELKNK